MQPIKLTIPGRYWDSQVYAGRLYLFGMDGDIRTLDWDAAIGGWEIEPRLKLALVSGFLRSDFLYKGEFVAFFRDGEVKELIESKFEYLATVPLSLDEARMRKVQLGRQDNLFGFPHADCEIYGRNMFVAGPMGIERATCSKRTKLPVSTKIWKRFDASVFAIATSYGTVASAAGSEGLFEIPAFDSAYMDSSDPKPSSRLPCEDCHWAFQSIYGTSSVGDGFLLSYTRANYEEGIKRAFEKALSSIDLFGQTGFSWGVQDKLCLATNGGIEVVKYSPWNKISDHRLERLGTLKAVKNSTKIVAAGSAPFGYVVEYEDALVVYPSAGWPVLISGEPVNWRVFPRSRHYENQLHVVYDDRLEIFSFNHDYFVEQATKVSGIAVYRERMDLTEPFMRSKGRRMSQLSSFDIELA